MAQLGFRTANRRYNYLFWPLMIVYVAFIMGTTMLVDEDTAPLWLKVACAIGVTVPLIGVLYAMRRLTDETDEYTRLNHMKAMRDGGLIIAGAAFLIGFLQIFEAIGDFPVFWLGPAYFIAYGLSHLVRCNFGRTV